MNPEVSSTSGKGSLADDVVGNQTTSRSLQGSNKIQQGKRCDVLDTAATAERAKSGQDPEKQTISAGADTPYCILPERQKTFLMLLCSFAAMISPMSTSIYLPALNSVGSDLGVSTNQMNLSITVYMVGELFLY